MPLRKLFAVAVASAVLGAQLWAIMPPGNTGKAWYWPLMDYPMYSTPHYAGESFRTYALRAVPCTTGQAAIPLSAKTLGITLFRYFDLKDAIGQAADGKAPAAAADSAVALVDRQLRMRLPDPVCGVQLWRKAVVLEHGGVKNFDPPGALVCEWSTTDEALARRRAGAHACRA